VHPPNLVYAKIAKVFTMCLAQSVHYVSVPTQILREHGGDEALPDAALSLQR
jgi:hypothetical protein